MSVDNRKLVLASDLDKPKYNSSLKLIKKFDDFNLNEINNLKQQNNFSLPDDQLEKIHEKASLKLNQKGGQIFEGLVAVEPNQDDFLKYLEIKHKNRVKPQYNLHKNNQKPPDLMEFYPDDLIKEYTEVDLIEQMPIMTTNATQSAIALTSATIPASTSSTATTTTSAATKASKLLATSMKASCSLTNDPINKYFYWN